MVDSDLSPAVVAAKRDSIGFGFGGTILLVMRVVIIRIIIRLIWGDIGIRMTMIRAGNGIISRSSIDTNPRRRRVFGDSISQCHVARTMRLVVNEVAISRKSTTTKTSALWKGLHPDKIGHLYRPFKRLSMALFVLSWAHVSLWVDSTWP